eukprot:7912406-Lingulodinium_polyedra.AAC.1
MGQALVCEVVAKLVARAKAKDVDVWFARVGLQYAGYLLGWIDERVDHLTRRAIDVLDHDEAVQ